MKVTTTFNSDTEALLTIEAEATELQTIKSHVLRDLGKQIKVAGFREGKVPAAVVEKNVQPSTLQAEFMEHAVNDLYPGAIQQVKLRPVDRPQVEIKKFVPFTTFEFTATVPVIGELKLADYKKIKLARPTVKITAKDVDEVITALRQRSAQTSDVDRPAKKGDQVVIDFRGVDDKGQAVQGAEGQGYPLTLGSNAFIPGFEDNLLGLKAGAEKTFPLKFPKDYGVKALAGKNVTFTVTVQKVQELQLPALDDAFAASVGPVKSIADLKADIKKELQAERQRQADMDYESDLIKQIAAKSKVTIPPQLIEDQVERLLRDVQQNLMYRGQTMAEFLQAEGKTEEQYRKEVLTPQAEERVKAGLVLAEISEREQIDIMPEELEIRMQALKSQYTDPQMQAELEKPETRREIASRMLSEKTMRKLADYAGN